jgi:hypothetical protein
MKYWTFDSSALKHRRLPEQESSPAAMIRASEQQIGV